MQPAVLEGLGEDVQSWSDAIRLQLQRLLEGTGHGAAELEARLLFAAIDGAAQHYAMNPEEYPLDEVGAALVQRYAACAEGGT